MAGRAVSSDFDTAGRYLAKMDAAPFVAWAARLPAARFRYRDWIDARRVRFPGEGDRTCDTVAWLEEVATGAPWAWPIEFQLRPDFDMFGRMLVYLGTLWLEQRPTDLPGDRFSLGAVVINLTGQGDGSRVMACQVNGGRVELTLVERNLAAESAADTLAGIIAGEVPEVVLGLIPLMKGGGEDAIIQAWLARAGAIADERRRAALGALARLFSQPSGCYPAWKKALEGWTMERAWAVQEWQDEARTQERVRTILRVLEARFNAVPADLSEAVSAVTDLSRLDGWVLLAATAPSVDQFRQDAGL